MARPIWKGSLRFGLVNIPVGLFPAETPDDLDLDLLDRRDMAPVGYRKYNKETGKELKDADIVKAYATSKNKYVVVSDSDLKRANPEASQTVDIFGFVDRGAIEPIYFDRPYYVAPDGHGDKAFGAEEEEAAAPPPKGAEVVDLMALLQRSVGQKRKAPRARARRAAPTGGRRKTA